MGREALDKIIVIDGGDGSTFIDVHFSDGDRLKFNPDVPYDGKAVLYSDGREEIEMD